MDIQVGQEAADIHIAVAQSERPYDSQLVLRSDGTIFIPGMLDAGDWRTYVHLDSVAGIEPHRSDIIHAVGLRFAAPDPAAAMAIHRRARNQPAHLEGPDWFWWHDGEHAWAITPRGEGHQVWWVRHDGTWGEYHMVNFPWHATVGTVGSQLLTWRDDVDQHGSCWGSIRTREPHLIIRPLTAWLKRQFTKETPMTHTLLIETTQGDLTQATISIDDNLSQRITHNTRTWVQGSIDGRSVFIQADARSVQVFDYPVSTDVGASILCHLIRTIADMTLTADQLTTFARQLAHEGWDVTHSDRGITLIDEAENACTPDPPSIPHWTPGINTLGHDRFTIDAATLRDLVDQADQYTRAIRGAIVHLDGRPYRLVDIPALREALIDANSLVVDAARDGLTKKAR